ncbi:FG-GAP and VCBS repeat-containing protein [Streptomyces sp. NPDC020965]|uniref:FG-GAP and VCBS repeat-containing protein n=1 Tax=Streptomyces sp. NPDC020965 TaxID=3365105 RepID=UPI0037A32788
MRKSTLVTAIAVASACLVGGLAPAAVAAPTQPVTSKAKAKVEADFNGDGHTDLVVNQRNGTVGDRAQAGAVVVLYGSKSGISSARKQVITQNSTGVPGTAEAHDRFGDQSVVADYDSDGYADLAISASGEDVTLDGVYRGNAGQTTIVWGGKNGLTKHGATTVNQTAPTDHDWRRGAALATGDFNGDGKADLATGDKSPGRGGEMLYGPINRKTGTPKSAVSLGYKKAGPRVSVAFDAGDVTGDGITDLVFQVYAGLHDSADPKTRINIHRGTKKGLVKSGQLIGAHGYPLGNVTATDGQVAVGDVNKDGYADIALGNGVFGGDRVTIAFGGPKGQSTTLPPLVITQESAGVPDDSEPGDNFGTSLSFGDTNADGYLDLAIGNPGEAVTTRPRNLGQVTVLLGGKTGPSATGARTYHQRTSGMPTKQGFHNYFGAAVKLADLNGDRRADVAVGSDGYEPVKGQISVITTPAAAAATSVKGVVYSAGDLGLTSAVKTGFGTSFSN